MEENQLETPEMKNRIFGIENYRGRPNNVMDSEKVITSKLEVRGASYHQTLAHERKRTARMKGNDNKCWQDVEKVDPLLIGVKWCSCFGSQSGSSSNGEIELSYDSAISLLGIYQR